VLMPCSSILRPNFEEVNSDVYGVNPKHPCFLFERI